jgi:hypothetical protein
VPVLEEGETRERRCAKRGQPTPKFGKLWTRRMTKTAARSILQENVCCQEKGAHIARICALPRDRCTL